MPFNSNIEFNIETNVAKTKYRSVGICGRGKLLKTHILNYLVKSF